MPESINKQQAADLILFPGCDPKNKLSDTFGANKITDKPEMVILNWLVSLPNAMDPAFAAQSILIKLKQDQSRLSTDQKSILTLLGEIARHPREKLLNLASKGARGQRRRNWHRQNQPANL